MINGIFSNTVPIMAGYNSKENSTMNEYINLDRVIYCQFDRAVFEHSNDFPKFESTTPEIRINYLADAQKQELSACVDQIRKVCLSQPHRLRGNEGNWTKANLCNSGSLSLSPPPLLSLSR